MLWLFGVSAQKWLSSSPENKMFLFEDLDMSKSYKNEFIAYELIEKFMLCY